VPPRLHPAGPGGGPGQPHPPPLLRPQCWWSACGSGRSRSGSSWLHPSNPTSKENRRSAQDRSSLCFLKEGYRTGRLCAFSKGGHWTGHLCAFSKIGTRQVILVLSRRGVQDMSFLCFLEEGYRTGHLCAFSKRGTGRRLCAFYKRGTGQVIFVLSRRGVQDRPLCFL
jgi:hypothetical protein